MQQPYIVGITGGSATGKTHFVNSLCAQFAPQQLCLISQDNYYRPLADQPRDAAGVANFDTPGSIDFDAFNQDLQAIRAGRSFTRPEYTFNNPGREPQLLVFRPAPVVVVEGIFVFYFPELRSQLDLKVYLDAMEAIKLKRRIVRDNHERGYDLNDVLYRYEHHVTPTFERYIAPYRHEADLVIPNNVGYTQALQVLASHLHQQVAQRQG